MRRFLVFLCFTIIWSETAVAETRFVTDQLLISLRPQPDDQSPPLERLPTGTAVEVLKDNGPFLKVKSPSGKVGFVRSQYFVTTPTRTGEDTSALHEQLQAEQRKSAELTAELENLKKLQGGGTAVQGDLEQARRELDDMNQKYQKLQQDCDGLEGISQEMDRLKAENAALKTTTASGKSGGEMKWFLSGGAVFFFGWLAGKMSRQKRRY